MKKPFEIAVAGAGVVGLTSAALLATACRLEQVRVTVIDAGERPTFDAEADVGLRVSAISAGSAAVLARIGVWDEVLKQRHCPYRDMRVWDAAGTVEGPEALRFSAAEFAVPELGFIVENQLLLDELVGCLDNANVDLCFESRIASIEPEGQRFKIELECGKKLHPELLLGADGVRSLVREQAGIPVKSWQYPQRAFVTHLLPQRPHKDTAWQRFLPTGPIGLLPLHDGRVSTVWSTSPELAETALKADEAELAALLTEASGGVLGNLQPASGRGAFPLQAQHADRYVMPGLALLGDAAHAVHPLAGQGANLGIADADQLANVVAKALEHGESPGDMPTLRRYERARKGENGTMLHFVDGLNRLFSNESKELAHLRGRGMRLFNKSGPIRNHAVQVALGMR